MCFKHESLPEIADGWMDDSGLLPLKTKVLSEEVTEGEAASDGAERTRRGKLVAVRQAQLCVIFWDVRWQGHFLHMSTQKKWNGRACFRTGTSSASFCLSELQKAVAIPSAEALPSATGRLKLIINS